MKLMRSVYCFDTIEILTSILCFNYSSNMEQLSSEALYSSEGKKFYNINKDSRQHIISLKILNIFLLWSIYFTLVEYVTIRWEGKYNFARFFVCIARYRQYCGVNKDIWYLFCPFHTKRCREGIWTISYLQIFLTQKIFNSRSASWRSDFLCSWHNLYLQCFLGIVVINHTRFYQ